MYKTIFNPQINIEIRQRISNVSSSSQRLWGIMTVEEMLWHLRSQLELAMGIIPQKPYKKTFYVLPPVRYLALYVFKWGKGLPTAKEMDVKKSNPLIADVASEKELLLQGLTEIESATDFCPHPLFGKMSRRDWGRLIWKHMDHHLRQFNS